MRGGKCHTVIDKVIMANCWVKYNAGCIDHQLTELQPFLLYYIAVNVKTLSSNLIVSATEVENNVYSV